MPRIDRFEDIEAWQDARRLLRTVHDLIESTRLQKNYVLRDQITRSAVSVMANIAEGFEHGSKKEFRRFLYIAKASAGELRALFYAVLDFKYISEQKHAELNNEAEKISRKLANFVKYLDKEIKGHEKRS
ncbi:MAG: four helix bundle protein [Planctomycetota bacterium]|nr:MAG: four helix bundle protein [Planctomycetota bacterium]